MAYKAVVVSCDGANRDLGKIIENKLDELKKDLGVLKNVQVHPELTMTFGKALIVVEH